MPQWQKNIYAIWTAQFLAMVGLTLIVPFLPFFLRTLGVMRWKIWSDGAGSCSPPRSLCRPWLRRYGASWATATGGR